MGIYSSKDPIVSKLIDKEFEARTSGGIASGGVARFIPSRREIEIDPNNNDLVTLAHEIGHARNNWGANGILKRKISLADIKNRPNTNQLYARGEKTLKSSILTNLEEINASRNGIKILKEAGMPKEDLEIGKKTIEGGL